MILAKFIDYIKIERRYSDLTVSAYERDLKEFCRFLQVSPEEFDPHLVTEDDIRAWLIEQMDNGISARSVRRKLSTLHSCWKYCLRIEFLDKDITQNIILPKIEHPLPVFYKEREMEAEQALAQKADDFLSVRNSLIIELLYETGMRQAELLGLTDQDVDVSASQVRIFGKRRKERIVPIGPRLLQQIQTYWEWRNREVPERTGETVLVTPKGKPMSKNQLYQVVHERMSEVSTLKKQSPHVLRHTFATTMLNQGADINTIKTLMGHASLEATQIYTHTTFEQAKQVYKKAHPRSKGKK